MQYSSSDLLKMVNEALSSASYDRSPSRLYEPVKYVLSLGGKRLRPILMLMAYNLYKDEPKEVLWPALGLETYHNYTLLHDDLMDKADVRRGNPTVHKVWDENSAILSGDSMLVLAYERIAKCGSRYLPSVLSLFTETALEIGEGQQYDMLFETRNDVSEAEYIEMIRLKTSVLLACSLKMGALLADAPDDDANALYRFGEKLGLAFQLQDDYLDVYGDFSVFGKKIGGDILCNKKTYLLINAFLCANSSQRDTLDYWISAEDPNPEDKISSVTSIYNQLRIPQLTLGKIDSYFAEAKKELDCVLLPNDVKLPLWNFALSLMNRMS